MSRKLPLARIRAHVENILPTLTARSKAGREDELLASLEVTFKSIKLLPHMDRFRKADRQARIFVVGRKYSSVWPHMRLILAVRIMMRKGQWVAALPGALHYAMRRDGPKRLRA